VQQATDDDLALKPLQHTDDTGDFGFTVMHEVKGVGGFCVARIGTVGMHV